MIGNINFQGNIYTDAAKIRHFIPDSELEQLQNEAEKLKSDLYITDYMEYRPWSDGLSKMYLVYNGNTGHFEDNGISQRNSDEPHFDKNRGVYELTFDKNGKQWKLVHDTRFPEQSFLIDSEGVRLYKKEDANF